jgi:hypothetical protein
MKYKAVKKDKPYQYKKAISGMIIPLAFQGGKMIFDAIQSGQRRKAAKEEMKRLQEERPNNYVSPELMQIKQEADERASIYRNQLNQQLANATNIMKYDPRQAANVGRIVEQGRQGMGQIAAQQAQENMRADQMIAQDRGRVQRMDQQNWQFQVPFVQREMGAANQQLQQGLWGMGSALASAAGQGLFDNMGSWFGKGGGNDIPQMYSQGGDDVVIGTNMSSDFIGEPDNDPLGMATNPMGNSGGINAGAGYLNQGQLGSGYQLPGNLYPGQSLVPGYNPSQNLANIAMGPVANAFGFPQFPAGPINQNPAMVPWANRANGGFVPRYAQGGMMPSPQPQQPIVTPGPESHQANPLDVNAPDGTKVAELTGGETVINSEDTNKIMELIERGNKRALFNYVRRIFNRFQKEQE